MGVITVRQLPDDVKARLRLRAAGNGRSMEAEARAILVTALEADRAVDLGWVEDILGVAEDLGGVDVPRIPDDPATVARFDG